MTRREGLRGRVGDWGGQGMERHHLCPQAAAREAGPGEGGVREKYTTAHLRTCSLEVLGQAISPHTHICVSSQRRLLFLSKGSRARSRWRRSQREEAVGQRWSVGGSDRGTLRGTERQRDQRGDKGT